MSFLHQLYKRNEPNWWNGSNKFTFVYWTDIYNNDSTYIKEIKDRK